MSSATADDPLRAAATAISRAKLLTRSLHRLRASRTLCVRTQHALSSPAGIMRSCDDPISAAWSCPAAGLLLLDGCFTRAASCSPARASAASSVSDHDAAIDRVEAAVAQLQRQAMHAPPDVRAALSAAMQ